MSKLRSTRGFTLIELLVVIVILAILMAIAIPTLLNQRNKARDADAKSDVTNAYRAMKAEYVEDELYSAGDIANAIIAEPQLGIQDAVTQASALTATEADVKVHVPNNQTVIVTRRSKSGAAFGIVAVESPQPSAQVSGQNTDGATVAQLNAGTFKQKVTSGNLTATGWSPSGWNI